MNGYKIAARSRVSNYNRANAGCSLIGERETLNFKWPRESDA